MIIFGWGQQIKRKLGVVFKHHCDHCNNEEYWVLTKISVWFTLFFIPVIPYELNYFLMCPVCSYGIKLDSKQFKHFAPIALNNSLLMKGKITEVEYNHRMKLLTDENKEPDVIEKEVQTAVIVEPKRKVKTQITKPIAINSFCTQCGNKILGQVKFCAECGSSVA